MKIRNLVLLFLAAVAGIANANIASAGVPQGVWLIEGEAAVQIFDCKDLLCARLIWLQIPNDREGQNKLDNKNPDPMLRHRELCGLTIIWDLRSTGPNQWADGWFYYPDSGTTYNVKMQLTSADVLVARFYQGISAVGETKSLRRTQHGASAGWC
jgi:uncharacterized protein (DUF2147 family)